jgi:hypothetical protein
LHRRKPEHTDQQRQSKFRAAEADQSAELADDRAAGKDRRVIARSCNAAWRAASEGLAARAGSATRRRDIALSTPSAMRRGRSPRLAGGQLLARLRRLN